MSTAAVFQMSSTRVTQEFEDLFNRYYPLIYRTAYRVTGSAEDAEDVVQTLFVRLLRSGLPAGLDENPKAYLYRSAVNAALNVVRSRQRHVLTADADLQAVIEQGRDKAGQDSAIHGLMVEAMAELNPRAVEMLILRYEHNYSDAEIAKLLGKSRGSVAVTLFRARARLKKLLRSGLAAWGDRPLPTPGGREAVYRSRPAGGPDANKKGTL